MIVDGGAALQPVLYSLALEAATGRPVVEGRLYYATTDGGYRDVQIPLTPQARRIGRGSARDHRPRGRDRLSRAGSQGEGVLLVRLQAGVRPDAPRHRIGLYKSPEPLADLLELRRKP